MNEERPDPDALLRRISAEEAPRRGRLKVFFGASPGVGKTYAMLEAARAGRREGVDVVIGWVETHGRAETAALAEGLERIPGKELEHRGVRIAEFDLDGALARKPALLLLDELAHTNAPGSRHAKRWQDAEELRDAGIDVYTTLNVQHLESLNDLVNQVTGVAVRETVPDSTLDRADEIEFVDLPPEELLKRLAEGKVYLPDRAAVAARHFFRRGNLLALRELALRRTAEHVDADVRDYRRDHEIQPTWPVAERILVCVRPNPDSERLVRSARRIAAQLRAEWIVAYVESPTQPPLSQPERRALASTVKLAERLGAETVTLSGESIAAALIEFARQRNVSRIVVGKPLHARWRDRLKGSLLDEIVRGSGDIEVVVIPGGTTTPGVSPGLETRTDAREGPGYVWSVGVVVVCTLLSWTMHGRFDNSNLIMVYLLGVTFVATRHGRNPSALAAVLSVAAFDFFFVPPQLTFRVSDTQYFVTFGIMLGVSLLVSTLASRVRAQAEAARAREQRTQVLYGLSRALAAAKTSEEVARAVSLHVSEILQGPAEVLLPQADGRLSPPDEGPAADPREAAVAQWVFEHRQPAGLGTDTLPAASSTYVPLEGSQAVVGVLGVRPSDTLLPLTPDQLDLLQTLARQAASGLERVRFAAEAAGARVTAEAERLRSTLLGSVSHDLRTPLAAIEGASSTLLDRRARLADDVREDLLVTIHEESQRLNRRVRNLLDMTRLEAGAVTFDKEWQPLEEVIGSALSQLEERLRGRPLRTRLGRDLLQAPLDAVLIEQVLVNLLENAIRYSTGEIEVRAWAAEREVVVEVADRGPGVPAGEEERIFERFHQAAGHKGQRGVGLGLAICRAIVAGHGGRIWVENRQDGGAAFRFTLPLEGEPPAPEPEETPAEPGLGHDERG